jgi:hypothetical protein
MTNEESCFCSQIFFVDRAESAAATPSRGSENLTLGDSRALHLGVHLFWALLI